MKKSLLIIYLFAFFLILPLNSAFVLADQNEEQAKINVGLYILNLGKFDMSSGTFTVDMYLSMKCEENCPEFNFEFMNGRASSIDSSIDTNNEKFYRIQVNLINSIDLKKYPFDEQHLKIILEDKKATISEIVYSPIIDESGIDDSVILAGWKIRKWEAYSIEHYYSVYNETYSQYVFDITISRVVLNSFIKTFLPIIFIVLVMLSSFILDIDKLTTRIAMAGSALVASVMFHISLSNQIPPMGYLNFADKFMLLTYFIVLLSFILNVTLLQIIEKNKKELAEKIHKRTEKSMLIIVPLLYILLFLFFI